MSHPAPGGRWRLVILDRDPADPKWLLATITLPSDVRPAVLDTAGRYTGWQAITRWVSEMTGRPAALVPVQDALAWRVDEGEKPR